MTRNTLSKTGHGPSATAQSKLRNVSFPSDDSAASHRRSILKPSNPMDTEPVASVSAAKIMQFPVREAKSTKHHRSSAGVEYRVDSYNVFEKSLDNNGKAITHLSREFLSNTHEALTTELNDIRQREQETDTAYNDSISSIFAPLSLSEITTRISDKTGITTQTKNAQIGDRLRDFKHQIESCDTELYEAWAQYHKNMAKMIKLGRDVLGNDMVIGLDDDMKAMVDKMSSEGGEGVTFKRQLALWEAENSVKVGELKDEVGVLGPDAMRRTAKMEKELKSLEDTEKKQLLMSLQT